MTATTFTGTVTLRVISSVVPPRHGLPISAPSLGIGGRVSDSLGRESGPPSERTRRTVYNDRIMGKNPYADHAQRSCPNCGSTDLGRPEYDSDERGGYTRVPCNNCGHEMPK